MSWRTERAVSQLRSVVARRIAPVRAPGQGSLVLGTARSGTTWLMELLTRSDDILPVFEPFYGDSLAQAGFSQFHGRVVRRRDEDDPALETYLRRAFSGQLVNGWNVRGSTLRQQRVATKVVVKEIRICAAAGWVETHLPDNRTIGIVRHPCASVSSMLTSHGGRWQELEREYVAAFVADVLGIDPVELLTTEDDTIRKLAAIWAVDNRALVDDTTPGHTKLVGFEELVRDPLPHLAAIDAHLRLDLDLDLVDPTRASLTADPTSSPERPVLAWRDRLRPADVESIMDVVRTAGITFVSEDPVVDMEAARSRQGHGVTGR